MPALHTLLDSLVYAAHFGSPSQQTSALDELKQRAHQAGIYPASLHALYRARGRGIIPSNFTVPAMNVRGLSYLTAQAAFEAALEQRVGLFIFELARSEMKYTAQTPQQVAASVLGAALRTGWHGPVFLQGDHYQPKAAQPGVAKPGEVAAIEQLIRDSVAAGFYNIDLDGSTLVDVLQPTEYDQQRTNFQYTAHLAQLIRSIQPSHIMVSIGCELSEVGTHLSKSSQLAAFMTGWMDELETRLGRAAALKFEGPSKVAIETGTRHGGVVNRDGSPGTMYVDYNRIKMISTIARHKYHMAGAVQHGASTLSKAAFTAFPEYETAEIHLSTGFQNVILDHPLFPQDLIDQMYAWCDENCLAERKAEWSTAQFYARARKKVWAPFKQATWDLPISTQLVLKATLKQECHQYFESLRVRDTLNLAKSFATLP